MAHPGGKIRLYVSSDLYAGGGVPLNPDQAHYLFRVMRQSAGGTLTVFNGRDGAWAAEITEAGKKTGLLTAREQIAPQVSPPDLTLLFAPIKKARTDFIVEKATELGARRIQPVMTRYTNSERLRIDRLQAHAVEAAEQCGGTCVPEVREPVKLDAVLDSWDADRRLMFCDEARHAGPAQTVLAGYAPGPWAILTGPEGGFAPEEAERLRKQDYVVPVTLGPRILRADTAVAAAISVWQTVLGDWQ